MFEYLLKLLTPKDNNGKIEPIIGYFIQNGRKKLSLVRSYAIKAEVMGLEVVIAESQRCRETNQGNSLDEYKTSVYLTQHPSNTETIQRAIDLLYDCREFYDQEVIWPDTPQSQANIQRAVVILKHRCLCPSWREEDR